MPNQRKKGLKLAAAFVQEKTYKRLQAEAKRQGISLADLLRREIEKLTNESSDEK
jgi:hypothetical protein